MMIFEGFLTLSVFFFPETPFFGEKKRRRQRGKVAKIYNQHFRYFSDKKSIHFSHPCLPGVYLAIPRLFNAIPTLFLCKKCKNPAKNA